MAEVMDIGGQHKCAYELCECQVSTLNVYCSDYCSDADDAEELELQCDCKHAPCALPGGHGLAATLEESE
jgi:hypothetical protein